MRGKQEEKKSDSLARYEKAMGLVMRGFSLVGESPEKQISWLMDFATRDLSVPGTLESARWEVCAFCNESAMRNAVKMAEYFVSRPLPPTDDPEAWVNPFREEEIVPLQHQLRQQLRELRSTLTIQFPAPIVHGITWSPKQAVWMVIKGKTAFDLFLAALVQFLLRVGKELRGCSRAECERFFLAVRPHQKYCSRQCENRVAVAKFRDKHPELPDRQHDRYEKKQKAKLGNVQVERRPRKS